MSDFRGDAASVRRVAEAGLDVYAHNIETVERLQARLGKYIMLYHTISYIYITYNAI